MDNFTLAVVVSDAVMVLAFITLFVIDKKKPPIDVVKPAGKR